MDFLITKKISAQSHSCDQQKVALPLYPNSCRYFTYVPQKYAGAKIENRDAIEWVWGSKEETIAHKNSLLQNSQIRQERQIRDFIEWLKHVCEKYSDKISYISDDNVKEQLSFTDISEQLKTIEKMSHLIEELNKKQETESELSKIRIEERGCILLSFAERLGIKAHVHGESSLLSNEIMLKLKKMCEEIDEFNFESEVIDQQCFLYGKKRQMELIEKLEESIKKAKASICHGSMDDKVYSYAKKIGILISK